MRGTPKTLEDLYRVFDSIESDEYGCQKYPSADNGYHVVNIKGIGKKRVSRLALERKLGRPIKSGFLACHTCDYPPCVNPEHLYEGTKTDNMRDYMLRHPEEFEEQFVKKRHKSFAKWV